ncbi:MAG: PD40 domain-containing protein [Anaerolineae bacterium]|nr:PD40 domain-containing protein [Anaerolineae bacterium]
MSEFTNPYRPGEPVTDPAMLFGRQDAADWIELQINSNNRILVLNAMPLIGKTSFLRHVGVLQNNGFFNLLVSLADLPLGKSTGRRAGTNGQDQDQTVSTVLQSILGQLAPQLKLHSLIDAMPKLSSSPQVAAVLRSLFAQAGQRLTPNQRLVLYIDDLHLMVRDDLALVASFLTSLMSLLDECPNLHIVFALNQDKLRRIRHPLLDGAPTFTLGTIPIDASISMITEPVKDALRFDYGITKRIAEINSHHPNYLCLFCYVLLNRQVHDGWVNQQDFDNTLLEILDSPIEPFRQTWDQSNWAERGVLSGMAAIQGAHGPITNQEIIRFLQRQNPEVLPDVVLQSLQSLVDRGVLVPMGAISYRFQVELFRYWLRQHTNPSKILGEVNWGRAAAQLRASRPDNFTTRPISPGAPSLASPRRESSRRIPWLAVIAALFIVACALVTGGGLAAAQLLGVPLPLIAQEVAPTPPATVESNADEIVPLIDADGSATTEPDLTPTPAGPAPTATPTAPLVVARTLPSITFMGRDIDQSWLIYVMNADGSDPTPISPAGGDDTGPIWSPDGQKIAFVSRRDGDREIYIMDSDGQNLTNVTRHPADDWTPAWSPDGQRLAFSSFRNGSWEIYIMDTACLSEPSTCPESVVQVTNDGNGNLSPVWSPDGTRFAFNSKAGGSWDIYTMAIDGSDFRQITTAPENDLAPAWSPDGTQIAFESNRDGNVEIYVVDAGGGVARNITNLPLADDHGPTWSPDGQQILFYSNREGNWDIFATTLDGEVVTNLTKSPARDEQTPAWRP